MRAGTELFHDQVKARPLAMRTRPSAKLAERSDGRLLWKTSLVGSGAHLAKASKRFAEALE